MTTPAADLLHGAQTPLHLYCHVPFCHLRCPWCVYMSDVPLSEMLNFDLIAAYVEALLRDIRSRPPTNRPWQSIVFGGGTPTLLNAPQVAAIVAGLHEIYPIQAEDGVTLSVEAFPSDVGATNLAGFRAAGFNRVSIGAQAVHDGDLRLLSRPYGGAAVEKIVREAHDQGFATINIDLMLGFPGHRMKNWLESLDRTLALSPHCVYLNPLLSGIAASGAYLARQRKRESGELSFAQQLDLLEEARVRLEAAGYRNDSSLLLFCLPGHASTYIRDTYGSARNVVAFGPHTKEFADDHMVLSAAGIERYIADPLGGRTRHAYRDHFQNFVRDGLIGPGELTNRRALELIGRPLVDGLQEAPVLQSVIERLHSDGVGVWRDEDFVLQRHRASEGVLRVLAHFDAHWK